jgi:hypothetical protein
VVYGSAVPLLAKIVPRRPGPQPSVERFLPDAGQGVEPFAGGSHLRRIQEMHRTPACRAKRASLTVASRSRLWHNAIRLRLRLLLLKG